MFLDHHHSTSIIHKWALIPSELITVFCVKTYHSTWRSQGKPWTIQERKARAVSKYLHRHLCLSTPASLCGFWWALSGAQITHLHCTMVSWFILGWLLVIFWFFFPQRMVVVLEYPVRVCVLEHSVISLAFPQIDNHVFCVFRVTSCSFLV